MNEIKVVWMDDKVMTYLAVTAASADERGQLAISYQVPQDGARPAHSRSIFIPLVNIRWWGQPGYEVAR